jgi:hypothetical protein
MRARLGSAESVVLPVPERPKKRATLLRVFLSTLARAVHREDADFGHVVVHGVEDALLHLAGVLGAEDDHDLAVERLGDEDRGP